MEEKYIKCPICGTVLPYDTEFCVYCATRFDHKNIEIVESKKDHFEEWE